MIFQEPITLIIDNGHGIETPGKRSPDERIMEWQYCRRLAAAIKTELEKLGINAVLLVPEDKDIALAERVKRANKIYSKCRGNNCYLVSVHINAAGNGSWGNASGWSVFVSKNASEKSKRLAKSLTEVAQSQRVMGNRSVPKEKFWTWSWTKADIYLLKSTACPAILTENMFMDNKGDVDFLLSDEGFSKLVKVHVDGIVNFLKN